MIAADTNVWIAYLGGDGGQDVEAMDAALRDGTLRMVPAVLTELLSDPAAASEVEEVLSAIPLLELSEGFWGRAGKLRSRLLAKGMRPKLADTLIAQTCIDHDVVLITRDKGLRPFGAAGLRLF